jgi:hypothetical protein
MNKYIILSIYTHHKNNIFFNKYENKIKLYRNRHQNLAILMKYW